MSFKDNKQKYIELFNECSTYKGKYELSNLDIEKKLEEIHDFKVTVPIVGGFSSGKSTFINTLLNDKVLAVSIVPETAIPTEVDFGEVESIRAKIGGDWKVIDRETLKANDGGNRDACEKRPHTRYKC